MTAKIELDRYMVWTRSTAIYPKEPLGELMYLGLGLAGEAGEVANKVKKLYRDRGADKKAIVAELGDVLWYWARLCDALGADPEQVLRDNMDKLNLRKGKGTLGGSGDDR